MAAVILDHFWVIVIRRKWCGVMKKMLVTGSPILAGLLIMICTTSASATTLQWLANGAVITTPLAYEIIGESTFGYSIVGQKSEVLCSVVFVGTVGPGPEGTISELLNLKKEVVTLEKPVLECVRIEGCMEEMTAAHLPWLSRLSLVVTELLLYIMESGGQGTPAWEFFCTSLGTAICPAGGSGYIVENNVENDVLILDIKETSECSGIGGIFGEETGGTDEVWSMKLTDGETLSVSLA